MPLKKLVSFLTRIDSFSTPWKIEFNRKSNFSSLLGGFLTLLLSYLFLHELLYKSFSDRIEKEIIENFESQDNSFMSINDNKKDTNSSIDLSSLFAFSIETGYKGNDQFFEFTEYLNIQVYHLTKETKEIDNNINISNSSKDNIYSDYYGGEDYLEPNNNSDNNYEKAKRVTTKTYVNYVKCSDNFYSKNNNYRNKEYFCINQKTLNNSNIVSDSHKNRYITGDNNSNDYYSSIVLDIRSCQNTTTNTKCKDINTIAYKINYLYFKILVNEAEIGLNKNTNTKKDSFYTNIQSQLTFLLDYRQYKQINIKLSELSLFDINARNYLYNKSSFQSFQIDNIQKESVLINTEKNSLSNNLFLRVYFELSNRKISYFIKYCSSYEKLSYFGGILFLLGYISDTLCGILNKYTTEQEMINELFLKRKNIEYKRKRLKYILDSNIVNSNSLVNRANINSDSKESYDPDIIQCSDINKEESLKCLNENDIKDISNSNDIDFLSINSINTNNISNNQEYNNSVNQIISSNNNTNQSLDFKEHKESESNFIKSNISNNADADSISLTLSIKKKDSLKSITSLYNNKDEINKNFNNDYTSKNDHSISKNHLTDAILKEHHNKHNEQNNQISKSINNENNLNSIIKIQPAKISINQIQGSLINREEIDNNIDHSVFNKASPEISQIEDNNSGINETYEYYYLNSLSVLTMVFLPCLKRSRAKIAAHNEFKKQLYSVSDYKEIITEISLMKEIKNMHIKKFINRKKAYYHDNNNFNDDADFILE